MTATKDKKNAYKIRSEIDQAVFKELLKARIEQGVVLSRFDRPQLSYIAGIATKAIMKDPKIEVVLKKRKR